MNAMTAYASLVLSFLTVIPSPSRAEEHHHDDPHGPEEHEGAHETGAVEISAAEREEFGIEVSTAGPGRIETIVSLPGEVHPNADRVAHIVPRYSGIVTDVRANLGDHVEKDQIIAIVESDESLAPFEVKTLMSGTVIAKHVTLGESVSRDHGIFEIADLSTVWIDLTVYQRDIGRVRTGQRAQILVGHGLAPDAGTISYVTPTVDERTRTATARVVLPNPNGVWRPGMFITGKVVIESVEVPVAVPRTALYSIDGKTVLFVQSDNGFAPQPVELGRAGETLVEIISGLDAGIPYVSEGGFTLKAELGKASFGDGHAH